MATMTQQNIQAALEGHALTLVEQVDRILADQKVEYPIRCENCGTVLCWKCEDET